MDSLGHHEVPPNPSNTLAIIHALICRYPRYWHTAWTLPSYQFSNSIVLLGGMRSDQEHANQPGYSIQEAEVMPGFSQVHVQITWKSWVTAKLISLPCVPG